MSTTDRHQSPDISKRLAKLKSWEGKTHEERRIFLQEIRAAVIGVRVHHKLCQIGANKPLREVDDDPEDMD